MRRLAILLMIFIYSRGAIGSEIDTIPWTASNIAKLNKLDKATVAAFINNLGDSGSPVLDPYRISSFKWEDLAPDGRAELMIWTYFPAISWLTIYWREPDGTFHAQTLSGEKNEIKDLDGTGKKEIIMDSYLDPAGRRGANPTPVWPQVYRLQGEKYVPATKDLSGLYAYYEREILPKLNDKIDKTKRTWPPGEVDNAVAVLEMQRDKILRVLELDPTAGLEEAKQWVKSENPDMVYNSWCVFQDIPGHKAEADSAHQTWLQAMQRQRSNGP